MPRLGGEHHLLYSLMYLGMIIYAYRLRQQKDLLKPKNI